MGPNTFFPEQQLVSKPIHLHVKFKDPVLGDTGWIMTKILKNE